MSADLLRRAAKEMRLEARRQLPGGRYERTFDALAVLVEGAVADIDAGWGASPSIERIACAYLGEAES